MRRGMVGVLAIAALVMAPHVAEAQVRPWEISIAGGPSIPVGDLGSEANLGYHVQGSVGFGLPLLPFGLRADLLWQEVPDVHDGWFRQIGGLANAVFGVPMVVIQPYGLLGVGLIRTEEPEVHHGDHAHTGATETTVGFNIGGGLDFPFMGLTGFLEVRYLNLFGGGDATHFQTVPISVGIRF
jgi:hypothetical protein